MRLQVVITIVTGVADGDLPRPRRCRTSTSARRALPAGSVAAVIGALVFMMTGFGLGWVNAAADYSRYLPRTLGGARRRRLDHVRRVARPVVLLIFGLLLAGSSKTLSDAIGAYPLGALDGLILPIWFLMPFAIVVVLGLIGGAVIDIYSSGLALLTAGLRSRVPSPPASTVSS